MFWHNVYVWDGQHKWFSQDEGILMFASGMNLHKKPRLGMSAPMNENALKYSQVELPLCELGIIRCPNLCPNLGLL
jgi:hypothetical protein